MNKRIILGIGVAAFALAGMAVAQQSGIKRTPLQKLDFPAGYNTVTAIAEIPAGGAAGRHTHPGAETGYVLEGELELLIDGQPPKKLTRMQQICLDNLRHFLAGQPLRYQMDRRRFELST